MVNKLVAINYNINTLSTTLSTFLNTNLFNCAKQNNVNDLSKVLHLDLKCCFINN